MQNNTQIFKRAREVSMRQVLLEVCGQELPDGNSVRFSCIADTHNDRKPSASVYKNPKGEDVYHCFSCDWNSLTTINIVLIMRFGYTPSMILSQPRTYKKDIVSAAKWILKEESFPTPKIRKKPSVSYLYDTKDSYKPKTEQDKKRIHNAIKYFLDLNMVGSKRKNDPEVKLAVDYCKKKWGLNENIVVSKGIKYRTVETCPNIEKKLNEAPKEIKNTLIDIGILGKVKNSTMHYTPFHPFNRSLIIPFVDGEGYYCNMQGRENEDVSWNSGKYVGLRVENEMFYNEDILSKVEKGEDVYVVEGFSDALMLEQNGRNAIGTIGTLGTITMHKFKKIFKFKLHLVAEGDEAGKKGVEKCVESYKNFSKNWDKSFPTNQHKYEYHTIEIASGLDVCDIFSKHKNDIEKYFVKSDVLSAKNDDPNHINFGEITSALRFVQYEWQRRGVSYTTGVGGGSTNYYEIKDGRMKEMVGDSMYPDSQDAFLNSDFYLKSKAVKKTGQLSRSQFDYALKEVVAKNHHKDIYYDPVKEQIDILRKEPMPNQSKESILEKIHNTLLLDTELEGGMEKNLAYLDCFMRGIMMKCIFPDVKYRFGLIIEGRQVAGKSDLCKAFALHHTLYKLPDSNVIGNTQETLIQLWGCHVVEWGEISGIRQKDLNKLKSWRTADKFEGRLLYSNKQVTLHPRFVVIMTTNDDNYQLDSESSRDIMIRTKADRDNSIDTVKAKKYIRQYYRYVLKDLDELYESVKDIDDSLKRQEVIGKFAWLSKEFFNDKREGTQTVRSIVDEYILDFVGDQFGYLLYKEVYDYISRIFNEQRHKAVSDYEMYKSLGRIATNVPSTPVEDLHGKKKHQRIYVFNQDKKNKKDSRYGNNLMKVYYDKINKYEDDKYNEKYPNSEQARSQIDVSMNDIPY